MSPSQSLFPGSPQLPMDPPLNTSPWTRMALPSESVMTAVTLSAALASCAWATAGSPSRRVRVSVWKTTSLPTKLVMEIWLALACASSLKTASNTAPPFAIGASGPLLVTTQPRASSMSARSSP